MTDLGKEIAGRFWPYSERLKFLWLSTTAIKGISRGKRYDFSMIHSDHDESLITAMSATAAEENEAREIGLELAEFGLAKMREVLDKVEEEFGLNAGEWVSRRWDGITTNGFVWAA